MILILSGAVQSGKTTTLMRWCMHRHDCGGILSPDVEGMRQLYDVRYKTFWPWQKSHRTSPTDQSVGRFVFDGESFSRAIDVLRRDLEDPAVRYLILDEVGPLELSGGGWDRWLRSALPFQQDKSLILVVRDTLINEVIVSYKLEENQIINRVWFDRDLTGI